MSNSSRDGSSTISLTRTRKATFSRLLAERRDRLFDLGKTHPVGVAQYRHHEPLLEPDRDSDVVMVLVDDVDAVDLGVDPGKFPQRDDRRLDEDRHEAKTRPVFFLERLS